MSNILDLDQQVSSGPKPAFNAHQRFSRLPNPYATLPYAPLIREAENILHEEGSSKIVMKDIFEILVGRHADHPNFGYDATRLLEQTWDNASPEIALDVMGNLTLLMDKRLLNSFYQAIAERMADRLENGGYTDVIGHLKLIKNMALRRGHTQWHMNFSNAYIGIFRQIMGDKTFLTQSIGMLPEVLRTQSDIGIQYDAASFDFIVNFLDENKAGNSGLIFAEIYDIFHSKIKLDSLQKDKLIEFAIDLYKGAPAFKDDPTLGVYQACQFFSNFVGKSKKWRRTGLEGIHMALNNLANLHGPELRERFCRAYATDSDLCQDIQRLLKSSLRQYKAHPFL